MLNGAAQGYGLVAAARRPVVDPPAVHGARPGAGRGAGRAERPVQVGSGARCRRMPISSSSAIPRTRRASCIRVTAVAALAREGRVGAGRRGVHGLRPGRAGVAGGRAAAGRRRAAVADEDPRRAGAARRLPARGTTTRRAAARGAAGVGGQRAGAGRARARRRAERLAPIAARAQRDRAALAHGLRARAAGRDGARRARRTSCWCTCRRSRWGRRWRARLREQRRHRDPPRRDVPGPAARATSASPRAAARRTRTCSPPSAGAREVRDRQRRAAVRAARLDAGGAGRPELGQVDRRTRGPARSGCSRCRRAARAAPGSAAAGAGSRPGRRRSSAGARPSTPSWSGTPRRRPAVATPLCTGRTDAFVNGCHGWISCPRTTRDLDASTARNDALCQPVVIPVDVPSGATSSTRTVTAASDAVVVSHRCAAIGPLSRRSLDSGALSYDAPPLSALGRSSVKHGSGSPRPAVHWPVDMVQIPDSGCWTNVCGVSATPGASPRVSVEPPRRYHVCGSSFGFGPVGLRLEPVVAVGVLRDLRDRGDVGVDPLQVLVEPAQLQVGQRRHAVGRQPGARRAAHVRPRPHHQARRDARLQPLVDQRLAALEQVVQAADDERRHLDPVEHLDRRPRLPERPVVGDVAALQGPQQRRQRERRQRRRRAGAASAGRCRPARRR